MGERIFIKQPILSKLIFPTNRKNEHKFLFIAKIAEKEQIIQRTIKQTQFFSSKKRKVHFSQHKTRTRQRNSVKRNEQDPKIGWKFKVVDGDEYTHRAKSLEARRSNYFEPCLGVARSPSEQKGRVGWRGSAGGFRSEFAVCGRMLRQ
ncbi:hypothetical protein K0M31_003636 [Melipona bicolor]|uniref:Uncharacterized protein n=1 Tax=Melipona bicolor TaxID=60889 RepID=A0AA40FZJ6_9HYME|nr:hypothetical protein K0M31_003636 [Melipona bicolor]